MEEPKVYSPDVAERVLLGKQINAYFAQRAMSCTCLWSNTAAGASSIVSRDPNCLMHGQKDSE